MRGRISKSEAQANAEALARRGAPYSDDHEASLRRRNVRITPTSLDALLRWFVPDYQRETAARLHVDGIEAEKPGVIERGDGSVEKDPGGGNALGAPRWDDEARQAVFGKSNRRDEEGSFATPMHWTIDFVSRTHPLKAALLRLIGRGGDWRSGVTVTCGSCTSAVRLPEEYSEAIARVALQVAYYEYREEPKGGYRAA